MGWVAGTLVMEEPDSTAGLGAGGTAGDKTEGGLGDVVLVLPFRTPTCASLTGED